MKREALILDGSMGEDAMAERSLEVVERWLDFQDWNTTTLPLRELDIAPCLGCFGCWIKTPGECVIDDAGRDVARSIVGSDLVVYLTPILFGSYSHELKKALDRSISIISPFFRKVRGEVHHKKRYARYPDLAAFGWSERLADADIFETLVQRNAINMHTRKAVTEVFAIGQGADAMEKRIQRALGEVAGG